MRPVSSGNAAVHAHPTAQSVTNLAHSEVGYSQFRLTEQPHLTSGGQSYKKRTVTSASGAQYLHRRFSATGQSVELVRQWPAQTEGWICCVEVLKNSDSEHFVELNPSCSVYLCLSDTF